MPRPFTRDHDPDRLAAGVVLSVLLATGCAGSTRAPAPTPTPTAKASTPAWIAHPPAGCALGGSGPTLDPGDAIRKARLRAFEQLAATTLGVDIDSTLYLHARREAGDVGWAFELTRHRIDGLLADSRLVAMAVAPRHAADRRPELLALACRPGAGPLGDAADPASSWPAWVLAPPRAPGRVCVTAVGGPTWSPEHRAAAALRDGRETLALALEAHIRRRTLDTGRGPLRSASATTATERARRRAAQVEGLAASWPDETGQGPLALRGVLYGLVCAETEG